MRNHLLELELDTEPIQNGKRLCEKSGGNTFRRVDAVMSKQFKNDRKKTAKLTEVCA